MKKLPLASTLAAFALLAAPLRAADDAKALVAGKVAEDYPQLWAFYEDLHLHPELSLMEERTSGKVAASLRASGLEVTEKFGGFFRRWVPIQRRSFQTEGGRMTYSTG